MKKVFAFISALLLFALPSASRAMELRGYDDAAGYQYIALGRCPQAEDGGERDILWRILEVTDTEAYLYSEYILFSHRVHQDDKEYVAFGGQWNKTELYTLLNQEKLSEWFTQIEQSYLAANEELGFLFLPSGADLHNADYGFQRNKQRQGYGTPYALAGGLFQYSNGSSPYWTRSQSSTKAYGTRCTKVDGKTGYIRCVVMNEGVRPAIRITLNELAPVCGDGTMAAPYRFARYSYEDR